MKYKLADGVKAQALAVHVSEQRPGLPYAVTVRKEVLIRPDEVVDTAYDLTPWVQAGLVVEVYDPAAKFKAALPVVEPAPVPEVVPVVAPEAPPEPPPEAEPEASSEGSADAAPLAKAAVRAARRRG